MSAQSEGVLYWVMDGAFGFFVELSLYELQRQPQQPITDDTEIIITPRMLRSELMCPICLDVLKHTMTTKEVSCAFVFTEE